MDTCNIPNEYFGSPPIYMDLEQFSIFKMTSNPRLIIGDPSSRFIGDPTSDPNGVTSGVIKKHVGRFVCRLRQRYAPASPELFIIVDSVMF